MKSFGTPYSSALLLLAAASLAAGQPPKPSAAIAFPATQPTSLPLASAFTTQALPADHIAQVQFAAGRLTVVADNSSLNQILHEISLQTGIKITGGVADDRVFGTYGPADPARILATLLDGTGSNMLLRPGDARTHGELILTPRAGGVTPPLPANTYGRMNGEDSTDLPAQRQRRFGGMQGYNGENQGQPNAAPPLSPQAAPATPGDNTAAVPAFPTDTTQQQSPNGVKTPQEIYDQLIKMQQQAAQQQRQAPPQ